MQPRARTISEEAKRLITLGRYSLPAAPTEKRSRYSAPLHEIALIVATAWSLLLVRSQFLCQFRGSLSHNAPFAGADESAVKAAFRRVETIPGTILTESTPGVNLNLRMLATGLFY